MDKWSDDKKRNQLLEFLDKNAFNPILRASRDNFKGEILQREFDNVKRSTESEKYRFHDQYQTAAEVKSNYLSDLNSKTAHKKNKELEDLGLPQLPQFRDEFINLCNRLGI